MPRIFKRVLQGLAAVLPISITLYLVYWLFSATERLLKPVVVWITGEAAYFPGLGILAAIPILFLAGLMVNTFGVRYLLKLGDRMLAKIPLIKSVYGGLQDVMRVFTLAEDKNLKTVVSLDMGNDTRLIGFVTGKSSGEQLFPGEDGTAAKVGVYLPMSYQIGGFTVYVEPDRLEHLDIGVEAAMRIAVTGGAPAPRDEK